MAPKKGTKPWNTGKKGIHLCPKAEMKKGEHRGKVTEFKKGSMPWNKGLTKETDERLKSTSEKLNGKPKSIEHRKNLSKSKMGHIPWNKGQTKETDARLWQLVESSRQMALKQEYKFKDTKIELKIDEALKKFCIVRNKDYVTNKPILGICRPDKVFEKQKLAIFCDGDYWHNLPNYKERDARITKTLTENEWIVLRFWEHEINDNIDTCINTIIENLIKTNFFI